MPKPTLRDVISKTIVGAEFNYESGMDIPIRVENRLNPKAIEDLTHNIREYFRHQLIPED